MVWWGPREPLVVAAHVVGGPEWEEGEQADRLALVVGEGRATADHDDERRGGVVRGGDEGVVVGLVAHE